MFTENELRILRGNLKAVKHIRELSQEENLLMVKVTNLINKLHFQRKKDEEREPHLSAFERGYV
jgi:hypothetical protein